MRSIERANFASLFAVFVFVYPVMVFADDHGWSPLVKAALGLVGLAVLVGVKFWLLDAEEWRGERARGREERAARRRRRGARRTRGARQSGSTP